MIPQDTSLISAVSILKNNGKSAFYPFEACAFIYACFVACHKIGEDKNELCREMDSLMFLCSSFLPLIVVLGAASSSVLSIMKLKMPELPLSSKIIGLNIVTDAVMIYGCYRISKNKDEAAAKAFLEIQAGIQI
jgi:hypothetical protein